MKGVKTRTQSINQCADIIVDALVMSFVFSDMCGYQSCF